MASDARASAAWSGPVSGGNFALSSGLSKLKPEGLSNTGDLYGVKFDYSQMYPTITLLMRNPIRRSYE